MVIGPKTATRRRPRPAPSGFPRRAPSRPSGRDRGRQVGDRVDLDERLQPARHRVRVDEDVAQERQREEHHASSTPITEFGVRRSRPNIVHTQESANEKTISSATAQRPRRRPARRPEAEDQAEHDDDRDGDRRSAQRRRAARRPAAAGRQIGSDRNRSKTPFSMSVFSADAGVHGDEHDADQEPGSRNCRYSLRRARRGRRRTGR